ncbi:MAG: response regulator [Oligosphaeraceae bacterium]
MMTTKEAEREFRFSAPDLSDGERLRELQSLVGGSSRLMTGALARLESYLGFLEDEVEGNARAEDFLREGGQLVARLRSLLGLLESPACGGVSQAGDVLRLPTLFHGLLERCRRLSGVRYEWRCAGEPQTCGELFSLQQVLFELLLAAGRGVEADGEVSVTVEEVRVDEAWLRRVGASCATGEYVSVDVVVRRGASEAAAPVEFGGLMELLSCPESDAVASCWGGWVALSGWLGVLRREGGELLSSRQHGGMALRVLLRRVRVASEGASAAVPAGVAVSTSGVSDEEMPHGTETILLVDDEDMIWDLVIDMLMQLGYTVLLAGNGREAVETYRGNPGGIDLVIMDMVMPEMNGREAFERLKACDPGVRVLLSSGYVSEEDAHYVMEAGALGFLRKPYRLRELAREVRRILDGEPREGGRA